VGASSPQGEVLRLPPQAARIELMTLQAGFVSLPDRRLYRVQAVVLFAIGLVLANVAGMQVWRRRFDRTASSATAARFR
jgi:hypothetical protein